MSTHPPTRPYRLYPAYCFRVSPTFNTWVKLTAADVQALRSDRDFAGQHIYFHLNHPIRYVRIVGVVVAIDDINLKYTALTIDDGSGATIELKIVRKPSAEKNPVDTSSNTEIDNVCVISRLGIFEVTVDKQPLDIGSALKAKCTISEFRGVKQLDLKRVSIVSTTDEEAKAWAETATFKQQTLSKPWHISSAEHKKIKHDIKAEKNKVLEYERLKAEYEAKKQDQRLAREVYHAQRERKLEARRRKEETMMNGETMDPVTAISQLSDEAIRVSIDEAGRPPSPFENIQNPLQYDPLPPDKSIRVLDLAPGSWDEPVHCSLRTVRLNAENLLYEAISYAWGDHTDRKTIVCNDSVFSTTRSLFEALQRFRRIDTIRTLWADAICINQDDTGERTSQVQLMSLIYSKASCVLIWLQHEEDDVVRSSLNSICRFIRRSEPLESENLFYRWHGFALTSFEDIDTFDTHFYPFDALYSICSAAWFRRGWILQEFALSCSACIYWGHAEFDPAWLFSTILKIDAVEYPYQCLDIFYRCVMIGSLKMSEHGLRQKLSFFCLLWATRKFTFSDPKDRIYGLLGLSTLECDPGSGLTFETPDYSISTRECYRRIAAKILLELKDPRVLCTVRHDASLRENWPSWVPDWSRMDSTCFPCFESFLTEDKDNRRMDLVDISRELYGVHDCIRISGFRIDNILQELAQYAGLHDLLTEAVRLQRTQELFNHLEQEYQLHPQLIAITFGTLHRHVELDSESSAALLDAYHELMSCLGPEVALPGDVIVALHGSNMPFVLRPIEKGLWRLAGECSISEYHDGRITREWERRGSVSENSCIY
ncbi:ob-fold nucleic acid binding domain [Stemphylium lycopersici]|nr:ob-fold nucleic acid binding domain [Stemphylium lycopersici]